MVAANEPGVFKPYVDLGHVIVWSRRVKRFPQVHDLCTLVYRRASVDVLTRGLSLGCLTVTTAVQTKTQS